MGDKEKDHSCAPNYERDHEQAQKLRIFLYENYPTDEDHEESEYVISIIATLTTRLAAAEKVVEEVRKGVRYAGGRWCEWGERAEGVYEIIDNALITHEEGKP